MSDHSGKVANMKRKIWTAAELEKMTPAERSRVSRAAEISDPNEFPELLERARESARRYMAANDRTQTA